TAGHLARWQGDDAQALTHFDEMLRIGRQHEMATILLPGLFAAGLGHCGRGEYEQALQCLREDLDLAARVGDKVYHCRALNTMGWVYMDLCHWDLALQYNAQSAAESRAVGD